MFRRNTLVSDAGRHIVVSTVGALRGVGGAMESVGHERWYETMAFVGVSDGPYIDADVSAQVEIGTRTGIYARVAVDLPPGVDNDANDMHELAVAWVVENFDTAYGSAERHETED